MTPEPWSFHDEFRWSLSNAIVDSDAVEELCLDNNRTTRVHIDANMRAAIIDAILDHPSMWAVAQFFAKEAWMRSLTRAGHPDPEMTNDDRTDPLWFTTIDGETINIPQSVMSWACHVYDTTSQRMRRVYP